MTPKAKAELDRWAASVPVGEEDMTPEQRTEFAEIARDFEAGRARMVAHEDVPAALEAMARASAA
jgi:hypothetical protein